MDCSIVLVALAYLLVLSVNAKDVNITSTAIIIEPIEPSNLTIGTVTIIDFEEDEVDIEESPSPDDYLDSELFNSSFVQGRIRNGHLIPTDMLRKMANIYILRSDNTVATCSGTLIATNAVVTAAHCANPSHGVYGRSYYSYALVAEPTTNFYLNEWNRGNKFRIVGGWVHNSFNPDFSQYNDIAVFLLDRHVPWFMGEPAALSAAPIPGYPVYPAGYGGMEINWRNTIPLCARNTYYSCRQTGYNNFYDSIQVCFYDVQQKTCTGDSGGPIFSNADGEWRLIGVINGYAGLGYCSQSPFSYGARVSSFFDFISQLTRTGSSSLARWAFV